MNLQPETVKLGRSGMHTAKLLQNWPEGTVGCMKDLVFFVLAKTTEKPLAPNCVMFMVIENDRKAVFRSKDKNAIN